MITRGTALASTFALAATVVLAGCGSSGGDDAASASSVPGWFQVRPVLQAANAGEEQCPTTPPSAAPTAAPLTQICTPDETMIYDLGPAVVTEKDVDAVGSVPNGAREVVQLTLLLNGKAAFTKMTATVAKKKAPLNQFAIVVDGEVVSAPFLENGPITDGTLEVSLEDESQNEPLMLRLSA